MAHVNAETYGECTGCGRGVTWRDMTEGDEERRAMLFMTEKDLVLLCPGCVRKKKEAEKERPERTPPWLDRWLEPKPVPKFIWERLDRIAKEHDDRIAEVERWTRGKYKGEKQ